jgi:hypothetical protein
MAEEPLHMYTRASGGTGGHLALTNVPKQHEMMTPFRGPQEMDYEALFTFTPEQPERHLDWSIMILYRHQK